MKHRIMIERMVLSSVMALAPITLIADDAIQSVAGGGGILWNNVGMVTHPGAGSGGADVSMASPAAENLGGSNAKSFPPDLYFRIADDFIVTETQTWQVSAVFTHAYETGAATPTWTGGNLNIWSGRPGDSGSELVFERTYTELPREFTGIYRVFNGAANLGNTDRPIHAVTWSTLDENQNALELPPGIYWIDWQLVDGVSAWVPWGMEANGDNPDQPFTVYDNGRHLTTTGWINIAGGEDVGVETPFLVVGTLVDSDVIFRDGFEIAGPL